MKSVQPPQNKGAGQGGVGWPDIALPYPVSATDCCVFPVSHKDFLLWNEPRVTASLFNDLLSTGEITMFI